MTRSTRTSSKDTKNGSNDAVKKEGDGYAPVKKTIAIGAGGGGGGANKTKIEPKEEPGVEVTTTNNNKSKKRTLTFEQRLEECKKFKQEHGHCRIPTTGRGSTVSLGIFVQELRRNFRLQMSTGKPRRRLTDEMLEELNAIGFEWNFKPKAGMPQSDGLWEKCFEAVDAYQSEHDGSFDLPRGPHSTTLPLCLAEWTCEQRFQAKRRKQKVKCNISPARMKKLRAIGFDFQGPCKLLKEVPESNDE